LVNICLFGGTFDPPHFAHLSLAETVLRTTVVDKVVFIPAFLPPHKSNKSYSNIQHRINMLDLALENRDEFEISEIESERKGKSYTVDTIKEYQKQFNIKKENLFFLIGSDSLVNFHAWRKPDEILNLAQILVVLRPTFSKNSVDSQLLKQVKFLDSPLSDISSSMIRQYLKAGRSVKHLIPEKVLTYIRRNELYTF